MNRPGTTWPIGVGIGLLLCAHASFAAPPECQIRLVNATSRSGVSFLHTDGASGRDYLFELMVGGLALLDYDGDGLIDIYLLNGASPAGTQPRARHALYRNNGDWTFSDVTEQAGIVAHGHGLGVAVGDYDNDGHPDLYVSNFGPNVLYHNCGDGTFVEKTQQAGVSCGNLFGAGTCFLDIEGDGDLDLYAAHYVDFRFARHAELAPRSFPYPPGPRDFDPVPDTLFRNEGNGTFADVSKLSGIASVAGPSMGMICFDYEEDGDTDIFVCNDGVANFLFQNDGRGRFQEVGLLAGVAYNFRGPATGSMGVDCGDYDGDGRLDLYVTDYSAEMPVLFRNTGHGLFVDATQAAGAGASVFSPAKWGTGFVDFDSDGDRDLFVANGHFIRQIAKIDQGTNYRVANCLLMNAGNARFVDSSRVCGDGLAVVESSRGAGFDDLDNDGDPDVVILNANARPTLLRNESQTGHHWLEVQLRGTTSNRDGVGSRVRVIAGNRVMIAEQHSGRGYQSHFGSRLHFGLGTLDHVDRIEVQWLGGKTETYQVLTVDRLVELTEGAAPG